MSNFGIRILMPSDATSAAHLQRHEDAPRLSSYCFGTVTTIERLEATACLPHIVQR